MSAAATLRKPGGVEYMESEGLVEFRYASGVVVTGDRAEYAFRQLAKGDELEYDGGRWLMYDREDRDGVTVHLFSPLGWVGAPTSRARPRKRF
jgi:hypothetical protein